MSNFMPDFLIIGGAKCATTWLQNSLQRSNGIVLPDAELHYFSRQYNRGAEWYTSQFPEVGSSNIFGEKSNSYLTDPASAARIRQDAPDVRFIVQMRDPVERAYSDYCMLFRRGEVSADIQSYLDPTRAADLRFINDGKYAEHLTRFLDHFPSERFLFLRFDDVKSQPKHQLSCLAAHIGYESELAAPIGAKVKDKSEALVPVSIRKLLSPIRPILDPFRQTAPVNALRNMIARPTVHPALPPDLRDRLTAFYADDIATLTDMTGLDLSTWNRAPIDEDHVA